MSAAEFEPAIPTVNRLQAYALDRVATGSDFSMSYHSTTIDVFEYKLTIYE